MREICLSMIVKNESARIRRCLFSLLPYIRSAIVLDTGSTDGTPDVLQEMLQNAGVWYRICHGNFHNFEQARNLALSYAAEEVSRFRYLAFCDADMELVVTDPAVFDNLTEPVYHILQISGDLSYYNTRLVRSDVKCAYRGVTHEYLDTDGHSATRLHGVHFIDHADGANRGNKLVRDEALLRKDLEEHPDNARSVFYLSQTVREMGKLEEARSLYNKRASMTAWEEESWMAKLTEARVMRQMGLAPHEWIATMMEAYNRRPWRAEPLWEIAKHFRETDQHKIAWLFIKRALELDYDPRDDSLFIEDYPRKWGIKEEAAICGYYAPTQEGVDAGHAACEELALSREAPFHVQENSWRNLFWYARPLKESAPSFETKQITFLPPDDYRPMNPSICRLRDKMILNVRAVNYKIGDDGRYVMPEREPEIRTRNFLFELHPDLSFSSIGEVLEPVDLPPPAWSDVKGFEDMRIFASKNAIWCTASVRQLSPDGYNEIVVAQIASEAGQARLNNWRVLRQEHRQHEKNWAPVLTKDTGWAAEPGDTVLKCFIYRCDPFRTVNSLGETIEKRVPPIVAREWGGSSQAIPFDDGYLMLVHERIPKPGFGQRQYQRRFVWLDGDLHIRKLTRRFSFTETGQGEFCCGMCWHPDGERLVMSWGVLDREAWLGTVKADDVRWMLYQPKALIAPLNIKWDGIPRLDSVGLVAKAYAKAETPEEEMPPAPALPMQCYLPAADHPVWERAKKIDDGTKPASEPHPVSWLDRNTNSVLKNEADLKWAITCVQTQGWPTHLDTTKHWDSYIAIEHTLRHVTDKGDRILDAGADRVSIYLPTLAKLGYKRLLGLNLLEKGWEADDGIVYGPGNIEQTTLADGAFAFVACLSVIEHGVNVGRFLLEMSRILRPGGHLFVSTDFWENHVSTGIADWKIFLPGEIENLIKDAMIAGFELSGHPLDLTCGEKICRHAGCDYSFVNMLFRKRL